MMTMKNKVSSAVFLSITLGFVGLNISNALASEHGGHDGGGRNGGSGGGYGRFDANHDGAMDLDEMIAAATAKVERRFNAKDADQDGFINFEEFIDVKGVNAMGNQLTKDKVNQVDLIASLPFEAPEEVHADELEVVDEQEVKVDTSAEKEVKVNLDPKPKSTDDDLDIDEGGQVTLF